MTKLRGDVIQAVPLTEGKINVGAGTYEAKGLIHCEADAEITLNFATPVPYSMTAGMDRGYVGSFTVVSGFVTYA